MTRDEAPGGFKIKARMLGGAMRTSMLRMVRSRFMLSATVFAVLPLVIAFVLQIAWHFDSRTVPTLAQINGYFENFLRILYLHLIIFFMANIFGFAVVRQELEERTLHYLFLQPAPRWVLLTGKFLGNMVIVSLLCLASFWLFYLMLTLPGHGVREVTQELFGRGRFMMLVRESLVLELGLMIYGAVAMLIGSFVRINAYAVLLLAWEAGVPWLPLAMKGWTATHYLHSLLPDRSSSPRRLFELLGEPAPTWLSLTVLCSAALIFMAISIFRFRFRECLYGETAI